MSSMTVSSKRSSKSIGDDPLGKKVNDFLGIDDEIKDIDLSENNDVFYEESSEDSFNIEFKTDSGTKMEMQASGIEANQGFQDVSITDDGFLHKNVNMFQTTSQMSVGKNAQKSTSSNKLFKSRMSTKLVGKYFNLSFGIK